jgi:hypothetical protein
MGLRERLRSLRRAATSTGLESYALLDGSRFYFDPTSPELYLFWLECVKTSADRWPDPPEVLRKLCEAKDVEQAIELVRGEGSWDFIVYDIEVLISERRLEPRPLVSSYDPVLDEHVPTDPYDEVAEDPLGVRLVTRLTAL